MRRLVIGVFAVLLLGAGYLAGATHSFSPAHSLAADDCQTFSQTGFQACGDFLNYWNTHGGLAQQGYPISPMFQEKSDTDGKTYTVQYFERAVFESHPENATPNNVLLSLLGSQKYKAKYPNGVSASGAPQPPVTPKPPSGATTTATGGGPNGPITTLFVAAVRIGDTQSINVQTSLGSGCDLQVTYAGGIPAMPIAPKQTDAQGKANWTFTVGSEAAPGNASFTVNCLQRDSGALSVVTGSFTVPA